MIQANSEIRFKLTEKKIKIFLSCIKAYTQKINKRFAQESKNKTEYPNRHFILCLNTDA